MSPDSLRLGDMKQDCGVGVARNRRFLGEVGIGFLRTVGVGVAVGFCVRL